jgi:hypothetical protein
MDDKKKASLVPAISYSLCAIVWCVNVFLDLTSGTPDTVSVVLHGICAVFWSISAVIWIVQYIKSKRNKT